MRKWKRNAEISIRFELPNTPKRPKPQCIPYFLPPKFGWRNPTRPEVKSEVRNQSSWLHRGRGGGSSDVGKEKQKKIRMKSLLYEKITNRRVMSHKCLADSYFKEKNKSKSTYL